VEKPWSRISQAWAPLKGSLEEKRIHDIWNSLLLSNSKANFLGLNLRFMLELNNKTKYPSPTAVG
jgi:hypothetical protein